MANEELAPAGVSAAMCHRERAGQILIGIDLTIDRIPRTSGAISLGTSSLDDKIGDDTMKFEPVIKSRLRQTHKIGHSTWRVGVKEVNVDVTFIGLNNPLSHKSPHFQNKIVLAASFCHSV